MKKYFLFFTFIGAALAAQAQQVPLLTQSHINPFLLNPAYAGNSDWVTAFLHTRNMWTSMPDAPQQYFLTVDGALNNTKVGLGLMVHANVEPIIRNIGALLTYRYKIRLAEHHFLSGGLSGGFIQNSLNFNNVIVDNPEEIAAFQNDWSKFNFNFNLGLLYQFNGLDVGVALKQLSNTPFAYRNTTTEKSLIYRLVRHYELSMSYHWALSEYFAIKPLFVTQSVEGMPFDCMLHVAGSYLDKYWIGAGYKLQSAYSLAAGLAISDRLTVGYNCDIPTTGFRSQFGVTHEVAIGYRFTRQSRKPAPDERISRGNVNRLQDVAQQQSEEIDRLKQSNEELKRKIDQQEEVYNSRYVEQQQLAEIYARNHASIDSLIQAYSITVESLPDKRPQQSYYVVTGAFYSLANAKTFQKILEREIGLETEIITPANGKYYFVYSKTISSKEEAKAEIKRLESMNIRQYIRGNLWIYANE